MEIKSIRFRYGRKFDRLVRSDYWRRRVHPGDFGNGVEDFRNSRDPKTRVPLSVERRMAHAMSVRRGRQIMRTRNLCSILRKYGLLPSGENVSVSERNPYKLRAKAVSEKVDMFGIGRAILHMNKRRGFKSNRKADKKSDGAESRGMKLGISKLREAMGDRTLGGIFCTSAKNPAWERE